MAKFNHRSDRNVPECSKWSNKLISDVSIPAYVFYLNAKDLNMYISP